MKNVAFVCVHNSSRSQMAEAISKHFASDAFNAFSAGTQLKNEINPDAVKTIQKLYGIDMTKTQTPKLIEVLPRIDIVITMGCNVSCPAIESDYREDWGLDDPTGKNEQAFIDIAKTIEMNVLKLKEKIQLGI
ncbi:arsenate reductase [Acholeplasma morum]|uniref:arsenate reductase/protein-tyrosine-phosphatase family protein n=1 Tax=Paracholeplasma morum TaxID=264637 RepID=UPI00195C2D9D|nr:arsenate reductase ArsC [Paracholeplasma morum]MBM7454031.1 arsenate reductase [Paracholeplasma morum]